MAKQDHRISLADLSAAGIRLSPREAATIVRDLVRLVGSDELPGVPSAHVIRITPGGALLIEGPMAAGGRPVSRAAQLLDALLPGVNVPPGLRAPGALRLVVARGLGTLDLPPYPSLESFAEALDRFAAPDSEALIRDLAARWMRAAGHETAVAPSTAPAEAADTGPAAEPATAVHTGPAPPPPPPSVPRPVMESLVPATETTALTISDIRRARRSTGLPLLEISQRSRIPVALLRQLEWGYLRNWPNGLYGRTQLIRYARAAGLDEHLVLAVVWPLLEEAVPEPVVVEAEPVHEARPAPVVIDLGSFNLARLGDIEPPQPAPGRRRRAGVLAAAAAAVLVLLAALPLLTGWRPPVESIASWNAAPAEPPGRDVPLRAEEPPPAEASAGVAGEPAASGSEAPARPVGPAGVARTGAPPDETSSLVSTPVPARGLTEDAVAYSPAFATEGSAIFFHADRGDSSALMRAETSEEGATLRVTRVVDDNARNFHARPSPDGEWIAFDSDRDGERGVYVARADGTGVRRVSGEGFAAVPSWSPDGGTLAFVRAEPDKPRVWNLWTVDLESGEMTRRTSHRYGQPWGGSWFPDGRRIAYSHEDRLIVLDLETGRQRVYPSPRKGQLVRTPAVSPDGSLVIFQVYRDGAWLLDLEDGSMRKVLADPTAEEYTWSPDGRRVAYHSRRSGEWGVWLMARR